jgi:glycosyltransferase involved in cell wall biosynthesis
MEKIREVTVYTNEDSKLLSSWSNVPFFFTEALISKGIKVNRVDLSQSPILSQAYNKSIRRIFKIVNRHNSYTYFRTLLHFLIVRSRIRRAIRQFEHSQAHIFLTFSFSSAGLTEKPSVLFCDWTYDFYINYFENRKPDLLEHMGIIREDSQIEAANLVFPLFPNVAQYMRKRYKNKNIFYLGNVVNSYYEAPLANSLVDRPKTNDLLFVGGRKYIDGARTLIQAYSELKNDYPDLQLHIIGMSEKEFGPLPDGITCYGYLDKGKEKERELYYSLFQKAKVFVNTTPKWGAFSAAVEAMFYYIPVIVTPFNEFVETFGEEIGFGLYCENNSVSLLSSTIRKVLDHKSYPSLCSQAHEAVRDFTWSAYIDKVLKIMEEKL